MTRTKTKRSASRAVSMRLELLGWLDPPSPKPFSGQFRRARAEDTCESVNVKGLLHYISSPGCVLSICAPTHFDTVSTKIAKSRFSTFLKRIYISAKSPGVSFTSIS